MSTSKEQQRRQEEEQVDSSRTITSKRATTINQ